MYFDIVVSLLSGRFLDLLTPGSNGAGADRHDRPKPPVASTACGVTFVR